MESYEGAKLSDTVNHDKKNPTKGASIKLEWWGKPTYDKGL